MGAPDQNPHHPRIAALFRGGPKTLHDERGAWRSSIDKEPVEQAIELTMRGLVGDKATKRFHGGPDAALCIHLANHYAFWAHAHDVHMRPGAVGENLTLDGITEDEISVGDIVRLGDALVQVSGPRVPCMNQARFVQRKNWVKLTIRENRTGFYMRVLEPGTLQAGDSWRLQQRLNEDASIPRMNRCMYLNFEQAYAERMLSMPGLTDWWKQQASKKLAAHAEAASNSQSSLF